ncbi:MAG: hypothetical protein QNK04_24880 [Myxococcota bacterium]|nr:hypothetical protein [Myxococcota bacterium]
MKPKLLHALDRRDFLTGAVASLLAPLTARADAELSPKLRKALETSPFVYVSPLRKNGGESTCHGEVWYGWIDGAVYLTTSTTTWKARSVARGHDRARLWVGDHGRWKRLLGRDESFRQAPSFDAAVTRADDPAVVGHLLGIFAKKYPAEFPSWKERMERGHRDGSRVLLRYVPLSERGPRT